MTGRWLAVTALFVVATVGCNKQPEPTKYKAVTPERIQLQQGGTVRIVPGGKLGTGISEKHTVYPNGDLGHVFYRNETETVRTVREEYANGALKSEANFTDDGLKVKHGEVRRPDGSLFIVADLIDDGSRSLVFYNQKNQKQAFRQWTADESSYVDTYFRVDGSVIGRLKVLVDDKTTVDAWHDVFPAGDQKVRIRTEFMQGGRKVIYFNAQDAKDYAQLWREGNYDSEAFTNLRLEQLEEYDSSGNVNRTLYFKEDKNVITLLGAASMEYQYPPAPKPGYSTRHFVIEGADMLKVDVETRKVPQYYGYYGMGGTSTKDLKRIFQHGPMFKVVKADGSVETHSTSGTQRESVVVARLKTFSNTGALDTARGELNRSDWSFLGAADKNDPCRWYFRKSQ